MIADESGKAGNEISVHKSKCLGNFLDFDQELSKHGRISYHSAHSPAGHRGKMNDPAIVRFPHDV
jgi:cytochrome c peroxidase